MKKQYIGTHLGLEISKQTINGKTTFNAVGWDCYTNVSKVFYSAITEAALIRAIDKAEQ